MALSTITPPNHKRPASADNSDQPNAKRQAMSKTVQQADVRNHFKLSKPAAPKDKMPTTTGQTACDPAKAIENKKAALVKPQLRSKAKGAIRTSSSLGNTNINEPYLSLSDGGRKERDEALASIANSLGIEIQTTNSFFRRENQPDGLPNHPLDCCTPFLHNFAALCYRIKDKDEVFKALRKAAKVITRKTDEKLAAEDIKEAETLWRIEQAVETAVEKTRKVAAPYQCQWKVKEEKACDGGDNTIMGFQDSASYLVYPESVFMNGKRKP